MRNQRGNTLLVYLGLAVVALGLLYALFQFIDSHWETSAGIERGESNKQALWDEANRKAEAQKQRTAAAVAKELIRVDENRLVAEAKADKSNLNWQEAVRESKRNNVALGVCEPAETQQDNAVAAVEGSGIRAVPRPPGIRLSWEFVRQFDSAWTDLAGESVFPVAAWGEGSAGSSPSPYTLEDTRDIAGINAQRCSADRREFKSLITKIEAAERAWDGAKK